MLDANKIIPPMTEDIIPLEPHFPDIVPAFPLGILTPIDAGADVILSGEERITPLHFQIDVYDTSYQRCEETAISLARRLTERGFSRKPGAVLKENGLHRHTLTFSARIDEHTGLIYRR